MIKIHNISESLKEEYKKDGIKQLKDFLVTVSSNPKYNTAFIKLLSANLSPPKLIQHPCFQ